jgi:formate hydrogenlyase subunit 6/NADH:ubiquinone oxidoreductase subunit I
LYRCVLCGQVCPAKTVYFRAILIREASPDRKQIAAWH